MPGLYVSGVALGALAASAAVAAVMRGPALAFVYPLSALAAVVLGVVDLHVLLDGGQTLTQAHDVTENIEQTIHQIVPWADVTVHPEPF